jgi:hypothetical protein
MIFFLSCDTFTINSIIPKIYLIASLKIALFYQKLFKTFYAMYSTPQVLDRQYNFISLFKFKKSVCKRNEGISKVF